MNLIDAFFIDKAYFYDKFYNSLKESQKIPLEEILKFDSETHKDMETKNIANHNEHNKENNYFPLSKTQRKYKKKDAVEKTLKNLDTTTLRRSNRIKEISESYKLGLNCTSNYTFCNTFPRNWSKSKFLTGNDKISDYHKNQKRKEFISSQLSSSEIEEISGVDKLPPKISKLTKFNTDCSKQHKNEINKTIKRNASKIEETSQIYGKNKSTNKKKVQKQSPIYKNKKRKNLNKCSSNTLKGNELNKEIKSLIRKRNSPFNTLKENEVNVEINKITKKNNASTIKDKKIINNKMSHKRTNSAGQSTSKDKNINKIRTRKRTNSTAQSKAETINFLVSECKSHIAEQTKDTEASNQHKAKGKGLKQRVKKASNTSNKRKISTDEKVKSADKFKDNDNHFPVSECEDKRKRKMGVKGKTLKYLKERQKSLKENLPRSKDDTDDFPFVKIERNKALEVLLKVNSDKSLIIRTPRDKDRPKNIVGVTPRSALMREWEKDFSTSKWMTPKSTLKSRSKDDQAALHVLYKHLGRRNLMKDKKLNFLKGKDDKRTKKLSNNLKEEERRALDCISQKPTRDDNDSSFDDYFNVSV